MPELTKPAIQLLQDLDLDASKQINPQHLDFLLEKLQKSAIAENRTPLLRSIINSPNRRKLEEIIRKRPLSEIREGVAAPEFEVVKTSEISRHASLAKTFDFNSVFTVADQTLGPFRTIDGSEVYYNFYKYINDFKIFFPGESQAAFIIPVRLSRVIMANPKVSALTLSKGNMWIRADLLDATAPKTNYVGLKIISGTLGLGGSYPRGDNSMTLPKNSLFDISINLDNSFVADVTEEIGLDGRNSVFTPSENIKLKTSGGKLILSDASILNAKTFSWQSTLLPKYPTFFWDAEKKYMCLFMNGRNTTFKAEKSDSKLYNIWGNSRILRFLWMFPTQILNQNQSVEVKFNGVLSLQLGKGLSMNWDGIRTPESAVLANQCKIMFFNGMFYLEGEKVDFQNLHDRPTMWQKSQENDAKMDVDISFSKYDTIQILSQSAMGESVSVYADSVFYIDQPLRADNNPVKPKTKKSFYIKMATKEGKSIWILDNDMINEDSENPNGPFSIVGTPLKKYHFCLENAYFTTTKETNLFLKAKYNDDNHIYEGMLLLNYGIFDFLPTLPHPYTTNGIFNEKRDYVNGSLQAIINITSSEEFTQAEVTFKMNHQFTGDEYNTIPQNDAYGRNSVDLRVYNRFMLFDVSTQSDHWGVSFSQQNKKWTKGNSINEIVVNSENVITINRNYLQAPMEFLNGLTLPQVSWEPVFNITPPQTPGDPHSGVLAQTNNSIPTIFSQTDQTLVKIHPKNYLETFRDNLVNGTTTQSEFMKSQILFTLPNGKYSVASLHSFENKTMETAGHLDFIMPQFVVQNQRLKGGIQFRIASYKNPNPDAPPRMVGRSAQLKTLKKYPNVSILGETVTNIFNNVFFDATQFYDIGVPVTHIDFSGYGASTFSDWKNPLVKFASISQAKFNILKGRTAHEIVQAVSVIYPWGICVTRTVTFLRNNNAVIFREDSGWVAQSEGFFDFSFSWVNGSTTNYYPGPFDIFPGMIEGLYKVKNIREDYTDLIKFDYNLQTGDYYLDKNTNNIVQNHVGMVSVEFVAVYFDTDVKLDALDEKVTGKHFKGYLQVKPEGIPIPARVLKDILKKSQNPISGNIEALLPVEKTLQKFKANAVEVTSSYQADNVAAITFVGAVKGSVILPPDGSWSVVEVDNTSGTVQNLAVGTSVGLIKDGLRPKNSSQQYTSPSTTTLLAFAGALKNSRTNFPKTYGFLQNTDTQKLLLKGINFKKSESEKYTSDPALLADCWRLMNSKGPFPNLNDAIRMENSAKTVMDLLETGVKKAFNLEVPANFSFDIVGKDQDPFHIYLKYNSINKDGSDSSKSVINYLTDSDSEEKWTNQMHNLTVAVDLAMFKPIMYISGDFGNGKKFSPSLNTGSGPQLKLDSTLQKIYDILEFLNSLDPTQPSEAIKKGLQIAMSNSADSWEYKFKASQEIPLVKFPFDPINYNSPTTPLKMDAFFRMGIYFNQPIKIPNTIDQIKPSVGTYLELGADLRVMCVSLAAATVYAVGRAEVGLAADLNTPPTLHFKFGFGIELAVGLPVIGSVAVTYMVGIDMTINSVELIVGAFIYFRGRVEIFGGVVTVTIAIEAAGEVQKKLGPGKPTNCIARCTFALDISIAWVININFTETWEETRQIS